MSKKTIENIENENYTRPFDADTLRQVASALGIGFWGVISIGEVKKLKKLLGLRGKLANPKAEKSPTMNRLFQLPAVVSNFTGRGDDIQRMADRLLVGVGGEARVTTVSGMGGLGKTSLAVKLAHVVKGHFPDAQIVVDLQGTSDRPLTAADAMADVIHAFYPEEKIPDRSPDIEKRYLSVLAGKRALVLLDNAKDEEQLKLLVTAPPPVGFVVTSRCELELDGVGPIRLDVLSPDEALALLRETVQKRGTDAELRNVAKLCGNLPLAVSVAGHALRRQTQSVPGYIKALMDEGKRLERLKGKTKDKDVEAVLALSARQLVLEEETLAEWWQMLSVFPADFDALATTTVWDITKDGEPDTDMAEHCLIGKLLDRNLLQLDELTGRYRLHDLMRPVARAVFKYVDNHPSIAGADGRLRIAELRFALHYCVVLATANEFYRRGHEDIPRGLLLFDQEERNIRRGQQWAAECCTDNEVADLCQAYANVSANVLSLRLLVREWIEWLQTAIGACRMLENRSGEGTALGNLGSAYSNLGDDRAAIAYFEQALAAAREITNRQLEGATLNGLGVAHASLGDARTAINYHMQALQIAREIGDRGNESRNLGNLGNVYRSLGDTRSAITYHEQALVITRELGDREWEGAMLGNLGSAHLSHGDAPTAITYLKQRLDIAQELRDRRGEGAALGNLGNAYLLLENARAAVACLEKALSIAQDIGDREREGTTLGVLGLAHHSLGDYQAAVTFHKQHLAIAQQLGHRMSEANANRNMAVALVVLGQNQDAIGFAEQSLAYFESINHPQAAMIHRALAVWRGETAS